MPHYADEGDFRKALITRLRQLGTDTGWGPQDAARAFALQQLTSRLFRSSSARSWVLTGGTALQYRSNEARPTTDADLAFAADAGALRSTLMSALAPREGEYGIFDVAVRVSADSGQHKARITYLVDGQRLASATLDVNTTRTTDFEPDTLTPAPLVSMPDLLPPPPMQVYPVARHLADKVAAMYERHGAASASPSTRPHDLADIVILARSSTVDARDLLAAIRSEEQRRGVTVPSPLVLPDELWVSSYRRRVERSGLPASLHEARSALGVANELLGPIMSGQVLDGRWDPASLTWTAGERGGVQPPLSMRMLFRAVKPRRSTSQPRQSDHQSAPQPPTPPIHEARPDTGFSL